MHHIVLDVAGDVLAERIRADTVDPAAMEWRTRSAATYRANREALMALGETIDTPDRDQTDVAWPSSAPLQRPPKETAHLVAGSCQMLMR